MKRLLALLDHPGTLFWLSGFAFAVMMTAWSWFVFVLAALVVMLCLFGGLAALDKMRHRIEREVEADMVAALFDSEPTYTEVPE